MTMASFGKRPRSPTNSVGWDERIRDLTYTITRQVSKNHPEGVGFTQSPKRSDEAKCGLIHGDQAATIQKLQGILAQQAAEIGGARHFENELQAKIQETQAQNRQLNTSVLACERQLA